MELGQQILLFLLTVSVIAYIGAILLLCNGLILYKQTLKHPDLRNKCRLMVIGHTKLLLKASIMIFVCILLMYFGVGYNEYYTTAGRGHSMKKSRR